MFATSSSSFSGKGYCKHYKTMVDKGQHDFCFLSRTSFKRTDYISDSLLATLDFETVGAPAAAVQQHTHFFR